AVQRAHGLVVELAVGLRTQATEPDEFGLRSADQFGRIGPGRRTLGSVGVDALDGRDYHWGDTFARDRTRKLLQIVDANAFAALRHDRVKLALFVLAGCVLCCGKLRLLAGGLGLLR